MYLACLEGRAAPDGRRFACILERGHDGPHRLVAEPPMGLEEYEMLLGRLKKLESEVGRLREAAQFALDFFELSTPEFVKKHGVDATRMVAASLREALEDA